MSPTKDEPLYWLSRETFASLLQAIVVTGEGSNLPVGITLNDGNESDALIALPESAKRNLKAIFFVVGGRIGSPHYLDRAALRDLVSAGMEIGSHGMHHCDWRKLDSMMLNVEIDAARRRIEDLCGRAGGRGGERGGRKYKGIVRGGQVRGDGREGRKREGRGGGDG